MFHTIRRLIGKLASRQLASRQLASRRAPAKTPKRRLLSLEELEARTLMAGEVNDLAVLNDEFDDPATLSSWQRVHEVEGWNADQLHTWDIDQTRAGRMTLQPETSVWYENWRGPMAYRSVTGDFIFTTEVHITDRDDVGVPDADDVPAEAQFSLAGLMVRTPRNIVNPGVDWQPGSQLDDGTSNGENYVFLSMGHAATGQFTFEVKNTRNSASALELTPVTSNTAQLQLARIGDAVFTLYRLPGQNWVVHRRFSRPDMPQTLQLGLVAYSDWTKASDFEPFTHNSTTLVQGVVDPTPYEPFNPDLDASFEFARYARPQVPADLAGIDLLTGATNGQLLSFLGDGTVPAPGTMNVGVNLESNLDWSPAWIFRDAFLRARPWGAQAYHAETGSTSWQGPDGPPLELDEHGWVAALPTWTAADGTQYQQRATTVIFAEGTNQPAGTYRVEWDGTGSLALWFVSETGLTPEGRHYALVQMPPGLEYNYTLDILATDPADPIRNINMWMPDDNGQSLVGRDWGLGAGESPFHPLFVERLQDFDTIRFMDWMSTNFTDVITWNDRRSLADATQSDGDQLALFHTNGIALEYMIGLANELDANPWFNMPHQADDDFVRNFATMVRDYLDPSLTIYVEWSNEVWNGLFPVYGWLDAQAQAGGVSFLQIAGQEMQRDFDIWSDVFAGQEERFVRIVAGQQANPFVLDQLLANVDGRVDAVSVSAYAGISQERSATFGQMPTTADDIIDALYEEAIPWALDRLAEHRALADLYEVSLGRDLPLLTYESGAHIIGNPSLFPFNDARAAAAEAMRSPRMYDVYQFLLAGARDAGVDLYNEFIFTGDSEPNFFGNYGLLFAMTESLDDTHQLRSLLDFIHAQEAIPAPEAPANLAPVFAPLPAPLAVEGELLVFQAQATDADADQTLTYSLGAGAPLGMSIDPMTGVVSWQPDGLTADVHVVTIIATDDGTPALAAELTVEISVANAAPTAQVAGPTETRPKSECCKWFANQELQQVKFVSGGVCGGVKRNEFVRASRPLFDPRRVSTESSCASPYVSIDYGIGPKPQLDLGNRPDGPRMEPSHGRTLAKTRAESDEPTYVTIHHKVSARHRHRQAVPE